MILHPSIIALLLSSILTVLLILYSAWYGFVIIRTWDIRSGSALQLDLERRTYLISTILAYVCAFQMASLFLYIFTADSLSTLFSGAMCAAGTLNVNKFGYPTLMLKILNFLLAGLWLILNRADSIAEDYPLVRKKYALLLAMAPLIIAEAVTQALYFTKLNPDVITSCCGSLFSDARADVTSELASLPVAFTMVLWYCVMAITISSGIVFFLRKRGAYILSLFSLASFLLTMASTLSFLSFYLYEIPTHHCPFCMLQAEYGYVGYVIYGALFGATVSGMGVGMLMPFRAIQSLSKRLPALQNTLSLVAIVLNAILLGFVSFRIISSNIRLTW